jgi:serine/threonine protein kinase
MMGGEREKVAAGNVRKVEDLRKGIRLQPKSTEERPAEDKVSRLEREYASVKYLDSGGFGEVWLAQTRDGQTVALKLLREPERHEDTFFRELQIWQGLVHRNIVRLLRPRVSPIPLFEMEYVDGGDLTELMKRSAPFSPERACRIAFDIARGLEYAHQSNVIHADLKPRNILLTKTEEAKISDWGLGKIASSSSKGIGFTPGYAAPEQIQRSPVDRRTDAYQLGVVLYEMLTGGNPFDHGSPSEKDEKVLTLVPEKPSRYNPTVQSIDDVLLGCLEKDPGNRPSIREFRETLSKYMNNNYGVLLQVTGQIGERVGILCRIALASAKQHDHKECLRALTDLKTYVSSSEAKDRVQSLVHAMEYREKEGLEISDDVLNDIDAMLGMIEHGRL